MKLYQEIWCMGSNNKFNKISRIILTAVFSILLVMFSFGCSSGGKFIK